MALSGGGGSTSSCSGSEGHSALTVHSGCDVKSVPSAVRMVHRPLATLPAAESDALFEFFVELI